MAAVGEPACTLGRRLGFFVNDHLFLLELTRESRSWWGCKFC